MLLLLSWSVCLFVVFPSISGQHTDFERPYACGELLEAGHGFFESPLFPDPYPNEVDCTWVISARPGSRIHLMSEYLAIEHQPECLWDYLILEDGEKGQFGSEVYCGSDELDFLSTSNVITVTFRTDFSGSDAGFRILYEEISPHSEMDQDCNSTLLEEGTVTSPGFPVSYSPDLVCFTSVQAPSGQVVSLEFSEFELETFPCDFDRLEVYDGPIVGDEAPLGVFCGRDHPVILTSESNVMTLKFVSDRSIQTKGFNATVKFVSLTEESVPASVSPSSETVMPELDGCNITITMSASSAIDTNAMVSNISSPGFPNNYPHNVHCVTKLRSDSLSSFLIKFTDFSLEEGENCTYDSLSIYEANTENGTSSQLASSSPLRLLCGQELDDPIFSWEGHGLDLDFRSDMSVSESGYRAEILIAPLIKGPKCPDVCENGGTCAHTLLADGSEDWMCVCTDGYTGTLCETQIRETCDDIHCQNGGVCHDDITTSSCVCPSGFSGLFCQDVDALTEGAALFFTKMASNMSLSVGSSVILECAVNDPAAHVMWLFQDRIMTNADWSRGVEVHPGGVIVIPEVKDEHSGRYTCMAITSGDLVERSMWITLNEPCDLRVTKSPSNITVREGQAALFQCYVPDADVTLWRKDGDLIAQGPRKRILVNHYLVINPVVETDAGKYTCTARSRSGCFSKVSAHLTVEPTGHGTSCGRPAKKAYEEGDDGITSGSGRISSGKEAPFGSAPWHVMLREEKKDTTFCGGSLISADTVLTAAHCIGQFELTFGYPFHPRHIQIYLGTHHCAGHNGIYRQLQSYIIHENFNNSHYNNDIALFKLDRPVQFSEDVMPICLETPEFIEELLKPGRLGVITGCGGRYAQGMTPTFLHQVQIPYVARDICRERALAVNATFTPGMFCAGYARSMRGDACAGDSGGPYVLEFSGRSIQVGIVSWGVGCDRENHYGYYTSLAHYYSWIMDKLGQQ